MTYNSALLAGVSAFSSACAEILTASRPTLSRLPCGQYVVWNKDTVIFLILCNSCRFTMTSWYLWSCIFTGVMSSSLSLKNCFITAKSDGVEGKCWFWAGTYWDLSCCIKKITKCRPFCSHVSEENNSRISFQGYAGPKIVFVFRGRFPKQPGKCKGETFVIGNSKS